VRAYYKDPLALMDEQGGQLALAARAPDPVSLLSVRRSPPKGGWVEMIDGEGYLMSGEGLIDLMDGGTYLGKYEDGKPCGVGRMVWPNGSRYYFGNWKDGLPHGHGIMQVFDMEADGWLYCGQFASGQRHGQGRCEWVVQRSWYCGDWDRGVQHGLGEAGLVSSADEQGPVLPPLARVWRMEGGERQEGLSNSTVEPGTDFAYVLLEQTPQEYLATVERSALEEKNGRDPNRDDSLYVMAEHWGFAFGNPDAWVSGKWGALTVTWIEPGGALDRWNQAQRKNKGKECVNILPNALIWKVNGVDADAYKMADIICGMDLRRLALSIRNPACVRYKNLRKNMWRRLGWFRRDPLPYEGSTWVTKDSHGWATPSNLPSQLPSQSGAQPSEIEGQTDQLRLAAIAYESQDQLRLAAIGNENPQDGGEDHALALMEHSSSLALPAPSVPPPSRTSMVGQVPPGVPTVVTVPVRGTPEPGLPAFLNDPEEEIRPPEKLVAQIRNVANISSSPTSQRQSQAPPVPPEGRVAKALQLQSWHLALDQNRQRYRPPLPRASGHDDEKASLAQIEGPATPHSRTSTAASSNSRPGVAKEPSSSSGGTKQPQQVEDDLLLESAKEASLREATQLSDEPQPPPIPVERPPLPPPAESPPETTEVQGSKGNSTQQLFVRKSMEASVENEGDQPIEASHSPHDEVFTESPTVPLLSSMELPSTVDETTVVPENPSQENDEIAATESQTVPLLSAVESPPLAAPEASQEEVASVQLPGSVGVEGSHENEDA